MARTASALKNDIFGIDRAAVSSAYRFPRPDAVFVGNRSVSQIKTYFAFGTFVGIYPEIGAAAAN